MWWRVPVHDNRDYLTHDRRVMRDVGVVGQQELQRMLALSKVQFRLGLALPVMPDMFVGRQGLAEVRQIREVNQQVEMAGVFDPAPGWCDAHPADREADHE